MKFDFCLNPNSFPSTYFFKACKLYYMIAFTLWALFAPVFAIFTIIRHFDVYSLWLVISNFLALAYWLIFIKIFSTIDMIFPKNGYRKPKPSDLKKIGLSLCVAAIIDFIFLLSNLLVRHPRNSVAFLESEPLGSFFNYFNSIKHFLPTIIHFISPGTFGISSAVLAFITFKLAYSIQK